MDNNITDIVNRSMRANSITEGNFDQLMLDNLDHLLDSHSKKCVCYKINCSWLISFCLLFRRSWTQLIKFIVVMKMWWPNVTCELLVYQLQLLLTYSQLGPRAIHFCAWAYVFTRIATYHVTTPTRDILAT